MKTCSAFALAACLILAAGPAVAYHLCRGSRCALYRMPAAPQYYRAGDFRRADCCGPPAPGWGWYLRQRYRQDHAPPLVIIDELDDVTFVRRR